MEICLAITFTQRKAEIMICKWSIRQPQTPEGVKPPPFSLSQEVKVTKNGTGSGIEVQVENAPLVLEFEKLLREPDTARSPAEGDVVIDDDDLRDLAEFV